MEDSIYSGVHLLWIESNVFNTTFKEMSFSSLEMKITFQQ